MNSAGKRRNITTTADVATINTPPAAVATTTAAAAGYSLRSQPVMDSITAPLKATTTTTRGRQSKQVTSQATTKKPNYDAATKNTQATVSVPIGSGAASGAVHTRFINRSQMNINNINTMSTDTMSSIHNTSYYAQTNGVDRNYQVYPSFSLSQAGSYQNSNNNNNYQQHNHHQLHYQSQPQSQPQPQHGSNQLHQNKQPTYTAMPQFQNIADHLKPYVNCLMPNPNGKPNENGQQATVMLQVPIQLGHTIDATGTHQLSIPSEMLPAIVMPTANQQAMVVPLATQQPQISANGTSINGGNYLNSSTNNSHIDSYHISSPSSNRSSQTSGNSKSNSDWFGRKERQAEMSRMRRQDPEYRKREADRRRARESDPEWLARKAELMRLKRADPDYKAHQAALRRARESDPDRLARRAEQMRLKRADPAYRAHQAEMRRRRRLDPEYLERERIRRQELRLARQMGSLNNANSGSNISYDEDDDSIDLSAFAPLVDFRVEE